MSSYPFNNSFTKKFQQEPIIYACGVETAYQNVLFRTFGINTKEVFAFGKPLVQQMNDNALIHRMMVKLINTDAPHIQRVTEFVQEIKTTLCSQASAEPFTAQYYNMLTKVLTSFCELVEDFKQNGHQMLTDKLTECFTGEINTIDSQAVCSQTVKEMYGITEDYMHHIGEFYEYFHMLLQKESENNTDNNRVAVMTHVEYYLDTLITCTEKLIMNIESTLHTLSTWKTALETRENQDLYN